jgi:hypothetical protein
MQMPIIVDTAHLFALFPELKTKASAQTFQQDLNRYLSYINTKLHTKLPLLSTEWAIGHKTWNAYRQVRQYVYARQWMETHMGGENEEKSEAEQTLQAYLLKDFPMDTVKRIDSVRVKAPILDGAQCAKWVRLYAQKLWVTESDYREMVQGIDARDQVRSLASAGRLEWFPRSALPGAEHEDAMLKQYTAYLKTALFERFIKEPPSDNLRSVCIPLYSDSNITPSTDGWHVGLVYVNLEGELEVSDYTCPPEIHLWGKQSGPITIEKYIQYMVMQRRQDSFHEGTFLLPDAPLYLKVKQPFALVPPKQSPNKS